jgi:hypothetical protein
MQLGIVKYLKKLYQNKQELTLIETTYGLVALVFFLLAAVVSLLDRALGVALLIIPLISFIALATNVVVWALLKLFLESKISQNLENDDLGSLEITDNQSRTYRKVVTDDANQRILVEKPVARTRKLATKTTAKTKSKK